VLSGGTWAPVAAFDAIQRASIASKACALMGFIGTSSPVLESPGAFGPPTSGAYWLNMSYCTGSEAAYMECLCPELYWEYSYYGGCYYRGCGYPYGSPNLQVRHIACREPAINLQSGNATALAANQVVVTCPIPGGCFRVFA